MSEKQQKLGAFGITETVIHQGKNLDTDILNTVNSSYIKVKCNDYGKGIKNNHNADLST